jgi:hypothetical protein
MRTIRVVLALALIPSAALAKKEHGKHPERPPAEETTDSPTGFALDVKCTPGGADVLVDGDKVGVAPMDKPVPVKEGSHTIKVLRLGYAPFLDTFSTKKKITRLEVELVPVSGVLRVKASVPGARVLVDGKFVGEAPVDVEMDVGARAVQVEKGGYKDFFQNLMSTAGKDEVIEVKLEELPPELNPYVVKPLPPAKWYQKKWVWGAVGGAAAGVALAIALGVVLSKPTDLFAGDDANYCLTPSCLSMGMKAPLLRF